MCSAIVYMNQYHSHLSFNVLMPRMFTPMQLSLCHSFTELLFCSYDVIINNEVAMCSHDVGILMLCETTNQIGVAYNVDSTE